MVKQGIQHLHVHSCADAAHLAALAHRTCGVPYSLTLHGDLPVYGVDHGAKMRDARFVSVVTRALQRQVVQAVGIREDRLPLIRMGIDATKFPVRQRARGDSVKLITVARLNSAKGHLRVLAAVEYLRSHAVDCTYTIVGDGDFRDVLERRVVELGLSEFVRFTGTLGEDAVVAQLADADIFVLASTGLGEAAPVSVMEAMAAGLPVVCSRIGGTPEMIVDQDDGVLVSQTDDAELFDALEMLAKDAGTRERMGRTAREKAASQFSAAASAQMMLNWFGEVGGQ